MTSRHRFTGFLFAFTILAIFFASPLPAAIIVDPDGVGATDMTPADPATWDDTTAVHLGDTGSGTLLVNNADTLDVYQCYLGYSSTAVGKLTIDGTGSTWTTHSGFKIGYNGTGILDILNGGMVNAENSIPIIGSSSGSTGTVNVDGIGSTWISNNSFCIGSSGDGALNITNGGTVNSENSASIGYYASSTSTATVSGSGSTWTCNGTLYVGRYGDGTLDITDGGTVTGRFACIGSESGSTGIVTVDGIGSTWNSSVIVGYSGDGTLNITNGGVVNGGSGHTGYIGWQSGSTGVVTVDGTGSTWTCGTLCLGFRGGTGTLNITNGGLVCCTESIGVSGTQSTIHFNGGTLDTGSLGADDAQLTGTGTIITGNVDLDIDTDLVIDSPDDLVGYHHTLNSEPDQNITVNYRINDNTRLSIGTTGTGSLVVRDGMAISSWYGYIGEHSSGNGTVTIDGPGAAWTGVPDIQVGGNGDGTLNIINGGVVENRGCSIGSQSNSTGNVTVDGSGSTWTNTYSLRVGYNGTGTLNITNGGLVVTQGTTTVNSQSTIHFDNGTLDTISLDADETRLTGTGTILQRDIDFIADHALVLDSSDDLIIYHRTINSQPDQDITVNLCIDRYASLGVGATGIGSLVIKDGMNVESQEGILGRDVTAAGMAMVDGPGTTWRSYGPLYVGKGGNGTLFVANGATLGDTIGYIGEASGSTGTVMVYGTGSTWTNSSDLFVGQGGNGTLNIADSATASSKNGYLGNAAGSSGRVTVDGTGSTWTNSNDLYVGNEGCGTLDITNGGVVSNVHGYIAKVSGSTGNVTVRGIGSTWTNSDNLYVGYEGSGSLHVADGATVNNAGGYIGSGSGSTSSVTVDGVGSTWTNQSNFFISNGSLHITNGGAVSNSFGFIGETSGFVCSVTVDGVGSTWINTGYLTIGDYGDGALNITNGATVTGSTSKLGCGSSSTGYATVDGTGSTWTNQYSLSVGHKNDGILNVTNGGIVNNTYYGYVGELSGSTGNVTIDGTGSTLANGNTLWVGYHGNGTLSITGGGTVSNPVAYIGQYSDSTGTATVEGSGSAWNNSSSLYVGYDGIGTLNITDDGLVSVRGTLHIDENADGDSFINMATGGMLALYGDADDSLEAFFTLIGGTDAIRYWDDSISDWADITGAMYGEDYTLCYITSGDLADYTVLTVTTESVPQLTPGDANGDGTVDGSDATILANYWQYGVGDPEPDATWEMGDFNGDHVVDGSDATILASYWQTGVENPETTAAVPEPGMVALLLTAVVGWFLLRRR